MWIDTHCHLDAREFDADREAVVARAGAAGVELIVLPAVDVRNFDAVRQLAHRHGLAYALGIHPLAVADATDADLRQLEKLLGEQRGDPRLVAIGEIGIDHFVAGLPRDKQAELCRAQLEIARAFGLPVLLHVRKSVDAVQKLLRRIPVVGGIAHAYNGSEQQARIFIDMGFKLGFGGNLTFDRALQIRRLAATLPLEAIVMETDSPDIAPQWLYRTAAERAAGAAMRNEPGELPRIGAVLAELRGIGAAELARATTANAIAAMPRLAALA